MKQRDSKGRYTGSRSSVLKEHPKFYGVWANMKERCDNPNYSKYKDYGGRGISYDPRWTDVNEFYKDMFPSYMLELTLDRRDNDGNYTPENCRWITNLEQQNNRRDNHYVTYHGETKSIADWARELGLKHNTLWHRIAVYKWPLERCMTPQTFVKGQQ